MDLSPRQSAYLDAILRYEHQHGRTPWQYELADLMGVTAEHARRVVKRLRKKGLIRMERRGRSVGIVVVED